MTTKFYNLATATCAVSAPDRVHAAMNHYLAAFEAPRPAKVDIDLLFQVNRAVVDDACQRLARNAPARLRQSHPAQRYRMWHAEGCETLMPEFAADHVITTTRCRIVASAASAATAATVGVRLVRQLIMRGVETHGGQALHAGATIVGGQGILIGGLPGAGKTTVLTRLAEHHGGRLISNDRTAVLPMAGACQAVAVPLAWRLTPEGAGGSRRLSHALGERQLYRGPEMIDGKIEITPLEMAQILGNTQAPECRVARVVILVRGKRTPSLPTARFLREHLSFGDDDFFAEDWLNLLPKLATGLTSPPPISLWKRLAELPVTMLAWTEPSELADVAARIAETKQ